MTLIEFSDAASFLRFTETHLMRNEDLNNMILSSALSLAKSQTRRSDLFRFYAVTDGKAVCGAVLNATDRKLLLSTMSAETAKFLAIELSNRQIRLRGMFAPRDATEAFLTELSERGWPRFKRGPEQRGLRLNQLTPSVSQQTLQQTGKIRLAEFHDLTVVTHWCRQFIIECELEESPEETIEVAKRFLNEKRLYLWEDALTIKAMAGFGGFTPNGVRVSMVYTAPEFRSQGIAQNLVRDLSARLLGEGRQFCFLFTDAVNSAANRLYENLGYKEVGFFSETRK